MRPVACGSWVRRVTLAKRVRRVATSGVGRKVGERIIQVGDAVVAAVVGAPLAGGAVD